MSETKTPRPGEWWVRNREGRIFYICGFDPEGCPVHWNEDVGFYASKMRFFCQDFYHEPRCTGFGWVETPAEVFPKYYILDETKGVCKAPWYIKRTSDKEGLRWGLNCDGVTVGFESQSWGGQADTWLEVTEAEALARVAIDPNDMPLNPVPGKVVATGTVTFTPVRPITCVACGVNWALDGSVSCRECYEHAIEATGCPVESPDNMAAIIAEHTQQVRELTQRIGELARQVNERDRVIEKIKTTLRQDYSV